LDLWLVRLIDEVINELSRNVAEQSLEEDQPIPTTEPQPSDLDQWTEHVSYPETVSFAELLPGAAGIESLDAADAEIHRTRLTELLGTLPHSQRQALLLLTNYGYNERQIADFQSRSADQVRADISAARETLRRELDERDWLDDAQERFAKASIRRKQQIQPGSRKAT
jgi:DNA-directed RNA polymerase specialized sigma24 family protein